MVIRRGPSAAASARAAVRMLVNLQPFCDIEIQLPNQDMAIFPLVRLEHSCEVTSGEVTAGVIKDAGDDPDCTHGIEIQCTARWVETPGIHLKKGVKAWQR
ncbi:cobalt-precorrin-5B (C(1))-methyltransferase [Vibrio sp. PP-XX7]